MSEPADERTIEQVLIDMRNREQDQRDAYSRAHHIMLGRLDYHISHPDAPMMTATEMRSMMETDYQTGMLEAAAERDAHL